MSGTHTFATLKVSAPVYDEIKMLLRAADYHHAFVDEVIDMHGIGLVRAELVTTASAADAHAYTCPACFGHAFSILFQSPDDKLRCCNCGWEGTQKAMKKPTV